MIFSVCVSFVAVVFVKDFSTRLLPQGNFSFSYSGITLTMAKFCAAMLRSATFVIASA
jgi:hypothetical protein